MTFGPIIEAGSTRKAKQIVAWLEKKFPGTSYTVGSVQRGGYTQRPIFLNHRVATVQQNVSDIVQKKFPLAWRQ